MTRPRTEAEHLARLVPASVRAAAVRRRSVLRATLLGGAALGSPGLLAACGGGSGSGENTVSIGSNFSDEPTKSALAEMVAAAEEEYGFTARINTVEHEVFQENINNYLQSSPDDVFSWFAGYRMRFFAERGLAGEISDVWQDLTGFTDAFKEASTADGEQYFVPNTYNIWAVHHRKSLFEERGYQVPTTYDEFLALAQRMQADGLVPLAFADKEGWPAMGTFDQLNMRLNGHDFHISLLAGDEAWNSPEVTRVFEAWRELLPLSQPDANGREWQEAATALVNKEAGMMIIGGFVGQQFPEADQDDLDFFNFPEMDPAIGADAVEAPIDGFMMARRPRNEEGAKNLLRFLGSPEAGEIYTAADPSSIAANPEADTSAYTERQRKSAEYVSNAGSISQFLDRDTRPDFASTVMIPSIQSFIGNPNDIAGLLESIEEQKQAIFTD